MANSSVTVLEKMVNSFTNADELMHFAATWGLQDSVAVRFRLFQLRNMQYDNTLIMNNRTLYYKLLEGRQSRVPMQECKRKSL